MIKEKTVFILGAGASIPYGMPSGDNLILNIFNNLETQDYAKRIIDEGFIELDLEEFRESLMSSSVSSIDLFLKNRPKFIKLGKILIAYELMLKENHDSVINFKSDWLRYLWGIMMSDCTPLDFNNNNITFITFNYDRILEHYLFTSLKSIFGLSDNETAKKIKEIPIFHVFGKLGSLPWEGNSKHRAFSKKLGTFSSLLELSESIKTIYEFEGSSLANNIYHHLQEAERIYFLGFGYHTMNLKLLKLSDLDSEKYINGTTLGISPQDFNRLKNIVPDKFNNLSLGGLDIYGFMKNKMILS